MDFVGVLKKRICVVGLGISGIETALFLERLGADYFCVEGLSEESYKAKNRNSKRAKILKNIVWDVDSGALPNLDGVGLAIVSPGYSQTKPIIVALKERQIPIVTEFELGLCLYNKPTILVTGSNGKSTVVSLIHHLLTSVGIKSELVGNIGIPVLSKVDDEKKEVDLLVVEASSYQLELTHFFAPDVAVFLNLSPNHLERHGSMEAYYQAKTSIFHRVKRKAVVNGADRYGKKLLTEVSGVDFSKAHLQEGTYNLVGEHNVLNIKAALAACEAIGIESEKLVPHLKSFRPLPHRYELLLSRDGIFWINDSKSTTPAATVAALNAFAEQKRRGLILLLGGLSKQAKWQDVKSTIDHVGLKKIIYFGRDGEQISKEIYPGEVLPTLKEAISFAKKIAEKGDTVLLSPGCASFDEFSSFEARGEFFRENL